MQQLLMLKKVSQSSLFFFSVLKKIFSTFEFKKSIACFFVSSCHFEVTFKKIKYEFVVSHCRVIAC